MTHKQRVLDLLADGQPHGHMEGYRLGVMLHSRVADLRADGYQIDCWRDGDNYLYRLQPLSGEATASGNRRFSAERPTASLSSPAAAPQPFYSGDDQRSSVAEAPDGQLTLNDSEFRRRVA